MKRTSETISLRAGTLTYLRLMDTSHVFSALRRIALSSEVIQSVGIGIALNFWP